MIPEKSFTEMAIHFRNGEVGFHPFAHETPELKFTGARIRDWSILELLLSWISNSVHTMVSALDRAKRALVALIRPLAAAYGCSVSVTRDSGGGAHRGGKRWPWRWGARQRLGGAARPHASGPWGWEVMLRQRNRIVSIAHETPELKFTVARIRD